MQVGQIFFSYSRADAAFALKLGEDLKKAGIDIWIDQIDIRPSEPWDEEIEKALLESQGILVILSNTSVESDNVLNEINYAIESRKQVFPILIEKGIRKPLNIIRLQHIDFTGSYEDAYTVLLNSLQVGKPVNPAKKQSPSMIVSIALVVLAIVLAVLLFRTNSKNAGNTNMLSGESKPASSPDSSKIAATNVTGVWTTEEITNPFDQFDKYIIDFELESFDSVIHGTIVFRSTVEYKNYRIEKGFLDGRINNGNLSFYTVEESTSNSGNVKYKNYYQGRLNADQIKFSLQSDRPAGFPGQRFVAVRKPAKN